MHEVEAPQIIFFLSSGERVLLVYSRKKQKKFFLRFYGRQN
jgi:hypothetical protein